ncbi:hypothetical protein [Actinomadura macrotermitis]|uniref:hypothetical protein n=1 Tax=Actinomadura macrotermitis TaxID=2585200 RepID=UPI00129764DD|nr:hypothetical protein [Actinomadura macrotermitis]
MRDEQAPPAHRYLALRRAVGHYRPLGFHATWAYVTALACPSPDIHRDPSAWSRALDILEAGRSAWLEEQAAFASIRRIEKAAGRRSPRKAPTGPRWPGGNPSRLGLVAAVANRHASFRRLPFPEELKVLHAALDAAGAEYLRKAGHLDGPARRSIGAITRAGHANAFPPEWRRFAELLGYAAEYTPGNIGA